MYITHSYIHFKCQQILLSQVDMIIQGAHRVIASKQTQIGGSSPQVEQAQVSLLSLKARNTQSLSMEVAWGLKFAMA